MVDLLLTEILPMVKNTESFPAPKLPNKSFLRMIMITLLKALKMIRYCIRKKFMAVFSPSVDQLFIRFIQRLGRIYGSHNTAFPGYHEIQIIFTNQELAELSVNNLSIVNRMLKKFERRGLIKFNGKLILVRRIAFMDFCN